MPDDVADTTTTTAQPDNGANTPAGVQNTVKDPVPYDRFKEINDKAKAYEAKIKEYETAAAEADKKRAEAETERMKQQGEFQKLAESEKKRADELAPYKERAERLEASLLKRWDAEKTDVSDFVLNLLENRPVEERLDYITDNRSKWEKATPNGVGSNPAGSTGKGLTTEEQQKRSVGMRRAWRGM